MMKPNDECLMMNEFSQGDKVKMRSGIPDAGYRVVLGQGELRDELTIVRGGDSMTIPAGKVLQVSEAEWLGDMSARPLPRIAATIVNDERLNERFSKIE